MKENKNYNFDLIIPSEVLEERKKYVRKVETKKMKKYRLKNWCKGVLASIFVVFIAITIIQFFTIKTHVTTTAGTYTCNGGWLQMCSGSEEVAALVD